MRKSMGAEERELQAEAEVGSTEFSRGVAPFLVALLLLVIAGVFISERITGDAIQLTEEIPRLVPGMTEITTALQTEGPWEGAFAVNRRFLGNLDRFTGDLERVSPLRAALIEPVNRWMTSGLGAQNANVLRGRDGWLFYQPAVDHLTGPGYLSARANRQGDPVAVLERFAEQLADRGITLIVAPLPVKAAIYPEKLAGGFVGEAPVQNPSHAEFLATLRARGVAVCDVSTALAAARDGEAPLYLARDSHWTPEGMKIAATALAESVRLHLSTPPANPVAWRALAPAPVTHTGDLAVMLAPEGAMEFGWSETVAHEAIVGPDDAPWAQDPAARVLLLGDSFVNIYDQAAMGWGSHGGLAARLALALQEPLDTITQNGDGAHATRQRLRQALQRDPGRLAGKEVVIFAFAARELSVGDWKPELALPDVSPG